MPSLYGSSIYGAGTYGVAIAEVSSLSIVATTTDRLDLSWTNPPTFPGFSGIIILRRENSAVTDDPLNGTSYVVNNIIGNSKVVFVGTTSSTSFIDTNAVYTDYVYNYKIFTFNNLYNYSLVGVAGSNSPIDTSIPIPLDSFWITNLTVSQLKLLWSYPPSVPDIRGIRIIRRIDTYATTINDLGSSGVVINVNYPDLSYTDNNLSPYIVYYYTAFLHDEIPNYSTSRTAAAQTQRVKDFNFIKDKVTNFQVRVDKERTSLYWDAVDRSLTMQALTLNNNIISLTNTVSSGTAAVPYITFTSVASGMSTLTNKYKDENIVFLDGRNTISYPKKITAYTYPTITIEPIEFSINAGERFGLDYLEDLIDSEDLYTNSTISYSTSASNLYFNVNAYDTATRSFTLNTTSKYTYNQSSSGASSFGLSSGDYFNLHIGYFPKLYISKDKGTTYDNGTTLSYSVSNIPITTNSFKITQSSLLNITDPNFYKGAYVTFLSGNNKGFSRKIISFNISTNAIITAYFDYVIQQNDIFTINTYSIPLVNNIENYVFKIILCSRNQ